MMMGRSSEPLPRVSVARAAFTSRTSVGGYDRVPSKFGEVAPPYLRGSWSRLSNMNATLNCWRFMGTGMARIWRRSWQHASSQLSP